MSHQTVQLYVWPLFTGGLWGSRGHFLPRAVRAGGPNAPSPSQQGRRDPAAPSSATPGAVSALSLGTREDDQGSSCFPSNLGKSFVWLLFEVA